MLPEDPWNNWWIKACAYVLLAAFGGTMGHLMRTIDSNHKIIWSRVFLAGLSAGFVGFLMFLLCQEFKLSGEWTGVVVGVFGWMGANATILVLEKFVFKQLGINRTALESEEPKDEPNGQ